MQQFFVYTDTTLLLSLLKLSYNRIYLEMPPCYLLKFQFYNILFVNDGSNFFSDKLRKENKRRMDLRNGQKRYFKDFKSHYKYFLGL